MNYPTWHIGDICQRMNGRNKSFGTVESIEEWRAAREQSTSLKNYWTA